MAVRNDVRIAFRQLRKSPAFTLVVLVTLGLCIGVNTAIYSVLDAVLLRPAPYPQVDRLGMIATVSWTNGGEDTNTRQNGLAYETVRDAVPALDVAVTSGGSNGANFAAPGHLEYIRQQRVSAGYFRVLGVPPQYGREFLAAEDKAGGPAITVLSYNFWHRVFDDDPAALGRSITLRGEPYTIVGMMPKGFHTNVDVDVWTPLHPSRTGEGGGTNYVVIARIKPEASWAVASEQLRAASRLMKNGPNLKPTTRFEERLIPVQSGYTQSMRSELLITWAAVLAVLLIGCVNIAGLLLARSSTRAREIATRMALGGGRSMIVRQLLVESLILALGGCVAGIGVGLLTIDWLKRLGAKDFEVWHPIVIDGRVMLAMLAIAALTSLLFGLMPALATSRLDIRTVLSEGGRGVAGGRSRSRQFLVTCEVALTLVLLVSAGLLLRTLTYLSGVNSGFDSRGVIAAHASLQDARYSTNIAINQLFSKSLDRIRRIPGVQSAAVALTLPYQRPLNIGFSALDGIDREGHAVEAIYTTPGYFDTMRIPMLRGRDFRDSDTLQSAPVAVVSQSFAAKYFRGTEAVGGHLDLGGGPPTQIIGVVGDVRQNSGLGDNLGPVAMEPTIYVPAAQFQDGAFRMVHTWFPTHWVIRAATPTGTLTAAVQDAVAGIDSQLPIAGFQTIEDLQAQNTKAQRYDAALFSILAGLALVLAALGLYGLISQSIASRTHEFGIRMALGATTVEAMANAVRPGILLALAGVAAGALLSRVAVRFLEHLLFGIRPTDPVTFAATAGILILVSALASIIPAFRILRLDPARTLRNE